MRAVIITGGSIQNYPAIKQYIQPNDYIICADSGYDHAVKMEITPNLLVGDMDSIHADLPTENIRIFPAKKDDTDTEIAISAALEQGCDDILILGGIGSRMDHTLANILFLKQLHDQKISAKIVNENNEIRLMGSQENITLQGHPGDLLSLIPITDCIGVTNKGFEYPLIQEDLPLGTTRGVSNVFLSDTGSISLQNGLLLVMQCRDLSY
ncbi:thiamine diphosphokinase [Clostridium facile]|uniref:Thiamine diphosphokinase n=1 Tax=Clostridium facile TaxID=2763035 RepID=A0ABR7IRW9_9CLOT|nr:thiamine diphosphokinase [Clostridium facile]MBC5787886.1 thiamine diphosphokinase [Clostridium facile]PWM99869.1 MAG: thiamine diphosphokinase [Massilioclostridium sp.]